MNTTKREKAVKELLMGKCWTFFNDNFHKFSQGNRIKIALALCVKDMPTSPLIDQSSHQHFVIFRNPKAIAEEKDDSRIRETAKQDIELPSR